MTLDQILEVKYHARSLANHALLAHYAETPSSDRYHTEWMHKEFLAVADRMGYDVIFRSAEQEQEAA
jgi:hypothetical protein